MELDVVRPQKIQAKSVNVSAKVRDSGSYVLVGPSDERIAELTDEYVPGFFPEQHYGDYLLLNIDLETGQILNWKKPTPEEVAKAFKLDGQKED